jgi:predicted CXXCH cytochrome family protein
VNGMRSYILICLASMVMLCGCEPQTRYKVLSFFFDGVPVPRDPSLITESADAKGTGGVRVRASKHGPYEAKMCAACHDPNTNALLLPRDQLCLKCHEVKTGRRQHGPFASGGCLVCHDPHRSSSEHLLVAPAKEFCLYCHESREILTRKVHQGMTVSCTVCHNPHGSDNEYFLSY